ncbi:thioesterase family protein [Psychrobacter sp. B38]|uniref:acyl-CoA thioesterase n=1 Tax=Psychrobacter sp. B38 TaxID=3143538 RepID=UPI00320F08C5
MKDFAILPEIQETLDQQSDHPLHGFAVVYPQQVAWGDMDAFGHVNNVVYYTYAQNARIHYNSQLNLFNEKTFSVMAASSCQYFKPVTHPDTLWIGVQVKKIGNASLIHEYTYYSTAMNTVVARGESVLVYLDKDSGEKKNIDESRKAAIAALEGLE